MTGSRPTLVGVDHTGMTTETVVRYDASMIAAGLAATTRKVRRDVARRILTLGPLPDLTEERLVGWLATDPRWAPETRSAYRQHARHFLHWAAAAGLAPSTTGEALPRVRIPTRLPRPCPWPLIELARNGAPTDTRAMITLGAYAGLRRAEIAALSWGRVGQDWLSVVGKGGRERAVPMHPQVAESLAALPRVEAFVFPGKAIGTHLSAHSVGQSVIQYLPRPWTCHTLRHQFATTAYARSKDIRAVQLLLGHSSVATTMRYLAMDTDRLVEVVGLIPAGDPIAA